MNSVDIADQLQLNYFSFSKWCRNKKWWWPLFLWAHRAVCTNAYKRHVKVEERGGKKPLTHRAFLEQLCTHQCMREQAHGARKEPRKASKEPEKARKRNAKITANYLDHKPWLGCTNSHLSEPSSAKGAKCSWCRFKFRAAKEGPGLWDKYCAGMEEPGAAQHIGRLHCTNCTLTFCSIACYREFHRL